MYSSVSVINGWQTKHNASGTLFGPAFNKVTELWDWQRENLKIDNVMPDTTCLDDFMNGIYRYMQDNPETLAEFNDAYHNADNRTINDIISDYISELEPQPT